MPCLYCARWCGSSKNGRNLLDWMILVVLLMDRCRSAVMRLLLWLLGTCRCVARSPSSPSQPNHRSPGESESQTPSKSARRPTKTSLQRGRRWRYLLATNETRSTSMRCSVQHGRRMVSTRGCGITGHSQKLVRVSKTLFLPCKFRP